MLLIEPESKVCERCYTGDLVPTKTIKGYHRKIRVHRIDSKCTHCNHYVVGEWNYEEVRTILDCIESDIAKLRGHYAYDKVIDDVSRRVTDSLLSDDNENSPYLLQQLRYLRHVTSHFELDKTTV